MLPSASNQMDSAVKEMNFVGHWGVGSKARDRYGRTVCENGRLLRGAILVKVSTCLAMEPPFRTPRNFQPHERVGEMPEAAPNDIEMAKSTLADRPEEGAALNTTLQTQETVHMTQPLAGELFPAAIWSEVETQK